MRKPQGYWQYSDPAPRRSQPAMIERDTFTCAHGGELVRVTPFCDPADAGGLCYRCNGLLCKRCAAIDRCLPLEKCLADYEHKINTSLASQRFLRDLNAS